MSRSPPTRSCAPSAPPWEGDAYDGDNSTAAYPFLGEPVRIENRQEQGIEAQIGAVLSRIETLQDLYLLRDEFGMGNDTISDLTDILGISYLDGQLAITPEGKVCVRDFITSHIEEISR